MPSVERGIQKEGNGIMGTRANPGQFDCYGQSEPDEPMFVLLARDPDFEFLVRTWAHWRSRQIACGMRPASADEFAQIREAQQCATEGEIWGRDYRQKRDHQSQTFDDRGMPLTGEHARKEHATTSGANDG